METTKLPVDRLLTKEILSFYDAANAAIQGKGSLIDALHHALDCAELLYRGANLFKLSVEDMSSLRTFLNLAVINYGDCYLTWCSRQSVENKEIIPLKDMIDVNSRIEGTVMILNCGSALGIVDKVAH